MPQTSPSQATIDEMYDDSIKPRYDRILDDQKSLKEILDKKKQKNIIDNTIYKIFKDSMESMNEKRKKEGKKEKKLGDLRKYSLPKKGRKWFGDKMIKLAEQKSGKFLREAIEKFFPEKKDKLTKLLEDGKLAPLPSEYKARFKKKSGETVEKDAISIRDKKGHFAAWTLKEKVDKK